jgi:hypothetical protein
LKDLADFFTKMPLSKGGSFKFIINTNQASMQLLQHLLMIMVLLQPLQVLLQEILLQDLQE